MRHGTLARRPLSRTPSARRVRSPRRKATMPYPMIGRRYLVSCQEASGNTVVHVEQ
ncbi:hypothetical protein [Corynebacterium nuruki]|uniref:hypothetical protein n=1 Tax=Corynebacterium nuruki TaxID=1032851 RepID=UPI0039BF052C